MAMSKAGQKLLLKMMAAKGKGKGQQPKKSGFLPPKRAKG